MSKNNMMCDPETGVCGVPGTGEETIEMIDFNQPEKTIDFYYVTDPICSHCWALEPVLRKFQEQYGQYFNFHTVMGGLLEKWDGFADAGNGISNPADVASHWREVGDHSRMPIDGTVWLDNPIHSSYPPSRVFKVIQKYDEQLANRFLRHIREELFAFNKNIAEEQTLIEFVNEIGLDGNKIVAEANQDDGQKLLDQDFVRAGQLGARGFPTIIMVNKENQGVRVVGARSFADYENALKQVLKTTDEISPKEQPSLSNLFENETRLFSKEIEIMYDLQPNEVTTFVQAELPAEQFTIKEVLGETFFEKVI